MQTIDDFIRKYRIDIDFEVPEKCPAQITWAHNFWIVTLNAQGHELETPYGGGSAVLEPDIASVLSCLASDSSGYDNAQDYHDWWREYGGSVGDEDAEEASRRTYEAIKVSRENLREFLTALRPVDADEDWEGDPYQELLYETEGA